MGSRTNRGLRIRFALSVVLVAAAYAIYWANIVAWRNGPNFGWIPMYDSGPNVVAEVFDGGRAAGLKVGDTISAINGIPYRTFDELYYKVRNEAPGSVNHYAVARGGETVEVAITTEPLGIATVLRRSGMVCGIGLVYILIGALVVLMKPDAPESRLFFSMTCFLGMVISFGAPSYLMRPIWMYDVRLLLQVFLPASMIHLALRFPKTPALLARAPRLCAVPYGAALFLFLLFKATSTSVWSAPPAVSLVVHVALILGVVVFLVSTVRNMLRDPSVIVRLQSRVIFVGILIGFLVPVCDVTLRFFWRAYLFPSPTIGFTLFMTMFPLSIGYTIVKHDLFAIDVMVRRTYGYLLSTAALVGGYALVISLANLAFRSTEAARSPLFSIGFALGAVFFFRPLHERIQQFVDRVFYRQQYDYRKTIQSISEAMTSVLDPKEIHRLLVGSVVSNMILENGVLALWDPSGGLFRVEFAEGLEGRGMEERELPHDHPLFGHLRRRGGPIFRYDVELDPSLEADRESLRDTFGTFASEAMLPLRHKEQLRGILSLGRKKSGKIFTHEDVALLKTISNEGAIALENAHLFEQNLEKGRMEEELKIARDIQVSMLPESAPDVEGLKIAARSIPAREVGGDFYDFVPGYGEPKGGKVAIVVGDVSGKGVSGALVMAASRSVFRVLSAPDAPVAEVMNRMNFRLCRDVRKGMFVAALYAVLDAANRTVTVANAGQTSPVLCPADGGGAVLVDNAGDRFPLGIVEDCSYEEARLPLHGGDTVVLYTDGVVEAVNAAGEMYGFERFLHAIGSRRRLSADALLEALLDDVSSFSGGAEQHDDITVVVAKVQ